MSECVCRVEGEMVATFCTSGEKEGLKGGVHAAACGLAVLMTVYNSAAWWYRRERHLGINTVVYATAVAWEIVQVHRHWSRLAVMQRAPVSVGLIEPIPDDRSQAA